MAKRIIAAASLVVGLLAIGAYWYAGRVNQSHPAPWPMAFGDSGHRSYTKASLPKEPTVLWTYALDPQRYPPAHRYATNPVIGSDGVIYVGVNANVGLGEGTRLLAIGPDGKRRWTWRGPREISSLALGRHGELYVHDQGGVSALNPNGELQWSMDVAVLGSAPLLVGQGGIIYAADGDTVYAIASDGSLKWKYKTRRLSSQPVELNDGTIVIVSEDEVIALTHSGAVAWRNTVGEPSTFTPTEEGHVVLVYPAVRAVATDESGYIYVWTDRTIFVFDSKGKSVRQWDVPYLGDSLALGDSFVQAGHTRWSRQGESLWSFLGPFDAMKQSDMLNQWAIADRDGFVLMMAPSDSTGVQFRGPGAGLQLIDGNGKERWSLDAWHLRTLAAVSAEGTVCFVGENVESKSPMLTCLGQPLSK